MGDERIYGQLDRIFNKFDGIHTDLKQLTVETAENTGAVKRLEKAVYGNGKAGVVDRLAELERAHSNYKAVGGGIMKYWKDAVYAAGIVGAYFSRFLSVAVVCGFIISTCAGCLSPQTRAAIAEKVFSEGMRIARTVGVQYAKAYVSEQVEDGEIDEDMGIFLIDTINKEVNSTKGE